MIGYLKTTWEFTKNIATTGAFSETSSFVVDAISKYVDIGQKQVIIEYGAGHGNITRGILAKMHPDSMLYAFEVNIEFCEILQTIVDKRLVIIPHPASEVNKYVLEAESICRCWYGVSLPTTNNSISLLLPF